MESWGDSPTILWREYHLQVGAIIGRHHGPYDYEVAILVPSKKAVETIDIRSSSEGEDDAPDRVHVKQEEADDDAAMDCEAEHEEVAPPPGDVHLIRRGPRIEAGEEWDDFCMYPNLVEMNPTEVETLRFLV